MKKLTVTKNYDFIFPPDQPFEIDYEKMNCYCPTSVPYILIDIDPDQNFEEIHKNYENILNFFS